MELDDRDFALIGVLTDGLPLSETPYADLGAAVGMAEEEVIARLGAMVGSGVIRRLGVIVRHHELGFTANAMVVWDLPDDRVEEIGRLLAASPEVTLCYRRPRRPPDWPYTLFCMVHGRDRGQVTRVVEALARRHGLHEISRALLFSTRRFKQCGAVYGKVA